MNHGSHALNQRFFGNASIFRCDCSAVAQSSKNTRRGKHRGTEDTERSSGWLRVERSHLSPDGGGFTRAAVHRLGADGYGLGADGYGLNVATCRQTVDTHLGAFFEQVLKHPLW